MNRTESLLLRVERVTKAEKESFTRQLAAGLLLLRYKGKCKCGLMLTERDQNRDKATYTCPHCGRAGQLAPLACAS